MADQLVRAFVFDGRSNMLPNPRSQEIGATYTSGTVMADANIATIHTAAGIDAVLAERDAIIHKLVNKVNQLEARIAGMGHLPTDPL